MTWRASIRYLFFSLLIIFLVGGLAGSQTIPPLNPPAWSVGDWWTVQCQVYDLGKVRKGAQPGWRPSQEWRFQVEAIEPLAGQSYYVVSVTPRQGNSCPYSFRYWFRVSDRVIGRRELLHPAPTPTKPRIIGPPTVTRDFATDPAAPFLTEEFPTLPVSMPLFGVTSPSLTFGAGSGVQRSQQVEELSLPALLEKANPDLMARSAKSLSPRNVLVTLTRPANVKESQHWNLGLPYPVYGESFERTYTSRRYWLVEVGNK